MKQAVWNREEFWRNRVPLDKVDAIQKHRHLWGGYTVSAKNYEMTVEVYHKEGQQYLVLVHIAMHEPGGYSDGYFTATHAYDKAAIEIALNHAGYHWDHAGLTFPVNLFEHMLGIPVTIMSFGRMYV